MQIFFRTRQGKQTESKNKLATIFSPIKKISLEKIIKKMIENGAGKISNW